MTVTPTVYLITRDAVAGEGATGFINGVSAVIINLDSAAATTAALQKAEAVKAVNAAFPSDTADGAPAAYGHAYFDTVQELGLAAGGVLATTLNTSIIIQDVNFGGVSAIQAAVT